MEVLLKIKAALLKYWWVVVGAIVFIFALIFGQSNALKAWRKTEAKRDKVVKKEEERRDEIRKQHDAKVKEIEERHAETIEKLGAVEREEYEKLRDDPRKLNTYLNARFDDRLRARRRRLGARPPRLPRVGGDD